MENNNSIHPDEMERLLRETFLNSPDSETDKISDMMANHVYNSNWNITPPIDKAQHFVAKKLFVKGFSLNFIIGTFITVIVVITAAVIGVKQLNKDTIAQAHTPPKQETITAVVDKDTLQAIGPVNDIVITEPVIAKKSAVRNKKPEFATEPKVDSSLAQLKTDPVPKPKQNLPPAMPKRYVLIPDISPQEAAMNEKRKQELVKKVLKSDRKEWSFIPMGTTSMYGKEWSIQAFYMQTHEVSNLQYRTFLYDLVINDRLLEYEKAAVYDSGWINISKLEPYAKEYFWNPAYNEYPVVNVSLEGAQMYCDWLTIEINKVNKAQGKPLIHDIRIPTVEEWIYAAKGGNDTAFYSWGGPFFRNSRGTIMGNFQTGRAVNDHDGADVTAPVISYISNNYGLYNMSGNVAEMTRPFSDGTLYIKGGAWNRKAEFMEIMHPNKVRVEDLPTTNVGFRPVHTYTGSR